MQNIEEQCRLNAEKIHVVAEQLKLTKRRLNRLTILYVITTIILGTM
jgi:hypothetical protein